MEDTNKKKHVVPINVFDPDYFEVGKAYHVTEGDKQYNILLTECDVETLTFVYVDEEGDQARGYLSINDYLDDKCNIEELVTVSAICDGLHMIADSAKDEVMKDFANDQPMVCREVDYENLTDRIVFGEDKVDLLMNQIFGIDGSIRKFYYKIDNQKIGTDFSVLRARYYISLKKLDDSYKVHPAFIENRECEKQFVSEDMIKNAAISTDMIKYEANNEIVTGRSFKEFKVSIVPTKKMWNVEIVSALQLLALVELGFKEANNENTTGKDFHGIKNLFNKYFQFVDGLTIRDNKIKVNGDTVCVVPDNINGEYIRYFRNMPPHYDWLFIPYQTTKDYSNSIGCAAFISSQQARWSDDIVAYFGGNWSGGSNAGFFYWYLNACSSDSSSDIGTRTMIK